jgi:hypothetical protein
MCIIRPFSLYLGLYDGVLTARLAAQYALQAGHASISTHVDNVSPICLPTSISGQVHILSIKLYRFCRLQTPVIMEVFLTEQGDSTASQA